MYPRIQLLILFASLTLNLQSQHISDFVSLAGGAQTTNFEYVNSHTFQVIIEQGDLLTNGDPMMGNLDFTGFVPINASSTNGYLSINHELQPVGGTTILDVDFDSSSQSWSHSASVAVDFSTVNGTRRNCSGTVTPWGTIVTSEESISGDLNSDGYNDFGWNIELDPVTKEVINQTAGLNNGDKLWSLGNFKHENIVVHDNQRTVYQAEDNSPGYLYKFVADVAQDLSAGDLYVYVGPKNGNGNWVLLANDTPAEQNSTIAQAVAVGATAFAGGEDVEISPIDGKIYVAVKNESRVYRFDDDSPLIGGTVSNFETYVGGTSYNLNTAAGVVNVPWGSGNDNLAFDDLGNLWVLQDGGNNLIWVVDQGHTQSNPMVRIFGKCPAGAEPTGMTFTPDYKYLFMSIQHPSSGNNITSQLDAFQRPVEFDEDSAIVMARKEHLGNCHIDLNIPYPLSNTETFQVAESLYSNSNISSLADVQYFAGDDIELDIGFEVAQDAVFFAQIQGCTVITP